MPARPKKNTETLVVIPLYGSGKKKYVMLIVTLSVVFIILGFKKF